jgi:hypothetical protein
LVLASAVFAELTLACALYTAAWAEATLPAEEVVLPVLPDPLPLEPLPPEPVPLEPPPVPPEPPDPPPADGAAAGCVGVAGEVAVGAGVGAGVGVVDAGVVVVGVVVVFFVGVVLVADTNSVVPVAEPELGLKLAVDVVEDDSALLSCSSAAVRFWFA